MNDQLTNQDSCPTPRTAARPIPEGMTVLQLGQYGRPSLATAGLLVQMTTKLVTVSASTHLTGFQKTRIYFITIPQGYVPK